MISRSAVFAASLTVVACFAGIPASHAAPMPPDLRIGYQSLPYDFSLTNGPALCANSTAFPDTHWFDGLAFLQAFHFQPSEGSVQYDGAFAGSLAYNLSNPKLGEEERKKMVERHAQKQGARSKRSHQKQQQREVATDPSEWTLAALSKHALSPLAPAPN